MTREDAIELVKSAFDVWEDKYSVGNDMNREHKARDMAIKALKQESILEKIKAKIDICYIDTCLTIGKTECEAAMLLGKEKAYLEVFKIIDEYTESESE